MSPKIEQAPFLDQLAQQLRERGWRMPALVALEAGRPLAFLGGQLLWVLEPAITLLLPQNHVQQLAQCLEEPTAVSALIARLEKEES